MGITKLKTFITKNPMIAYPVIVLVALGVWSLLMMVAAPSDHKPVSSAANPSRSKSIGVSVGGADQQAYIARLEKNYYDFEDRVKSVERQVKGMKSIAQELKKRQKEMARTVLKLDEKLIGKLEEKLNEFQQVNGAGGALSQEPSMELSVADIKPVRKDDFVYLPIGSFCKGTLLTGVYAAADVNNPLPVLIALDEAFYGPNKTRIPLKGAFILGKAHGDLVSQRALIQVTAVSSVLPDGRAFEREDNLGYVTDEFGELGIRGQVLRNTGKALALSFMGGFMAGGAQAIADSEVTSTRTPDGVTREVQGNAAKNAVFSGLAKSAGRMSDYYGKQAENLVPAVHVRSGANVYFIVQKGVSIDGLLRADYTRVSNIN
ncbi:MAG: hypothetical protein HY591_04775 [Candidatus Omnitrophica bacterium]|nr:hypothetical protein [Candidatus Omnitrophota bacterium]